MLLPRSCLAPASLLLCSWSNLAPAPVPLSLLPYCSHLALSLLLLCACPAPNLLLPCSCSCPAPSPALFLLLTCSCFYPAPAQLLPLSNSCFCPAYSPTQLLPGSYSCPAPGLPCFCPLWPCSCSSPALFPLLLLPTPVWQPSSSSAPYDFFRHGESRLLW